MHAIKLSSAGDGAAINELRSFLIGAIGHRSILERYNYLEAAVGRRQQTTGAPCYSSYLDLIRTADSTSGELDELIKELTIGETAFFRYQQNFAALREHFKALQKADPQNMAPIRVWSAGCSNGAEAYSVLILARTMHETGELRRPVEVIGTDINRKSLREAQEAVFRKWVLRCLDPETIRLWFEEHGGDFALRKKYRSGVSFTYHNLLTGVFAGDQNAHTGFDAILCCNVMIYFDHSENSRLLGRFSQALRPDGLFLTGPVDYFAGYEDCFEAQKLGGTYVYRHPHPDAIKHQPHDSGNGSPAKPIADRLAADSAVELTAHETAAYVPSGKACTEPISRQEIPPATKCATDRLPQIVQLSKLADSADWDATDLQCKSVLEADPTNPYAYYYQSLAQFAEGALAASDATLRQALHFDASFALARFELARRLFASGDTRTAEHEFSITLDGLCKLHDECLLPPDNQITALQLRGAINTLMKRMAGRS